MDTLLPITPLRQFIRNDSGAVTVDWVVLTAAIVGLGLATIAVVSGGFRDGSNDIAEALSDGGQIYTSANFGRASEEVLANTTSLNSRQISNRLNTFMNNRTEAQVRRAVRNWERIASDPSHKNHAKAGDQLKVLNEVMEARGIAR